MPGLLESLKRRLLRRQLSPTLYARYLAGFHPQTFFDPGYYLRAHPDAADAVARGRYESALDHFIRRGLAEGRQSLEDFDERWYVRTYPEVGEALARGEFASAFQHYLLFGMALRFRRNGPREVLPRGASRPAAVDDLLAPAARLREVVLEFTTRCNLRCTYCHVSQPDYVGTDLDLAGFDAILDDLRERNPELITVNGHGETTMIEGWERYCARLIDEGFRLHLVTNFARPLGDAEADLVARFDAVDISCDTADPELFRRIRRGGDFRTILFNIGRVRAAALRMRRPGPLWKWSCVVTDRTIGLLDRFVEFGIALGVSSFRFMNLSEYPELERGERVRHPATMPLEALPEARAMLLRCHETIVEAGGQCEIEAGILDAIDSRLDETREVLMTTSPSSAVAFSGTPAAGQTRDCLDPWEYAYIHATRTVRPCCSIERSYGSIAGGEPLLSVLGNDDFRNLRAELLAGELNPSCRGCPARSIIPVADLQSKVRSLLESRAAAQ